MSLGIAMAGCEPHFRKYLERAAKGVSVFTYLEIGFACGQTLAAVADWLATRKNMVWRVVGIDLKNGWSVDSDILAKTIENKKAELIWKPSEEALGEWQGPIHFAFIDGCHELECCKQDFEMLEPHIVNGGIVAMHDSAEREQGTDPQPHRGQPIAVRQGAIELGLLNGSRKGWKLLEDVQPEIERGCLFVQKV